MSPLRLSALLPLVLVLLAGCEPTPPTTVAATGSMRLAISTPPSDVSRVTVTVAGADMDTMSTDLVLTNGAWGGVLGNIPAGTNRTFLAQAFSSSNTLRYDGSAQGVTIVAGATGLVTLTLRELSSPPPFTNEAPILDSLVANPTTVAPGGSVSLTASAHDPNAGDTMSFAWAAPSGSFADSTQASTTWTAPGTEGPVTLWLTVSDSRGARFSVSLTVYVSTGSGAAEVRVGFNSAPRVLALTSSQSWLEVGQKTELSVSATDADGDGLSYQWSATCAGSFGNASATSTTFSPSNLPKDLACNNCQLSVTVQDGRGGQNLGSVALCVSKEVDRRAPPMILSSYQSSPTATAGQTLTFEVRAKDPAGTPLLFAWTASAGTTGTATSDEASTSRITWTAPSACINPGTTPTVTATVTNGFGLQATRSFSVTGLPGCPRWLATGTMNAQRFEHTATLLPDGKVLVAGGATLGIHHATAELYDPATGTWTLTGPMVTQRSQHAAVLLTHGKVLVMGGQNGDFSYLKEAEVYDPATGTWSATSPMTTVRYTHRATLLANGKVLVTGGQYQFSNAYLSTSEVYDPATGTWSSSGAMSAVRTGHTSTLLPDGKVLVAGGGSGSVTAGVDLYEPTTGAFGTTSAMSSPRTLHSGTRLSNGKVLVAGGGGGSGVGFLATAEVYDPATSTWSPTGAMASKRMSHGATLLSSGKVLVSGGYNNTQFYLAGSEVYDPATGTWSPLNPLLTARYAHSATLLPNGKVLIAGGRSANGFLASAEVYDAQAL
ncbi:MAG TPA: kelch repeat-containing protein [Archangium sp.]|nr:kelch repeat-containing protein [Archangium sp.]